MTDYIIGHIRTIVPIAVGAALAWLATTLEIGIDDSTATGLVVAITGLLSAGYYAAVRAVAERYPGIGIMLGYNKAPAYDET